MAHFEKKKIGLEFAAFFLLIVCFMFIIAGYDAVSVIVFLTMQQGRPWLDTLSTYIELKPNKDVQAGSCAALSG